MRPCICCVEDPEMQIADLAVAAIRILEVAPRHHAMEHAAWALVVAPAKNFVVESAGRGRIVGSKIDEDERVGRGHVVSSCQAAYSLRFGVKTSRLSTGSSPTTTP